MKRRVLLVVAAVVVLGAAVVVSQGIPTIKALLESYQEVPAVSSVGSGELTARINPGDQSVSWELTYSAMESDVTQAHIHLGQRSVNGGISVFLCTNLGNAPEGVVVQPCPVAGGTISGTFDADDVIGPGNQGIAAGQFAELLRAIRAGVTYVNIHTVDRAGGEVRSQIDPGIGQGHH